MRAFYDKLEICRDAGIDVDKIPLSLTISDVIRMPIERIRELANSNATSAK
jgi:hypothetical protein